MKQIKLLFLLLCAFMVTMSSVHATTATNKTQKKNFNTYQATQADTLAAVLNARVVVHLRKYRNFDDYLMSIGYSTYKQTETIISELQKTKGTGKPNFITAITFIC